MARKRKNKSTLRVQQGRMSSIVISSQTKGRKTNKGTKRNKKYLWSRSKASLKEKEK